MRKETIVGTPEAADLYRHDGAWYRKVARRVVREDIGKLVFFGDNAVRVIAVDNFCEYLPNITGYIASSMERLVFLEPLDTSATDDYHERGGTLYRKERRKAQVGELVLVVNAISNSTYENGDISSVVASFGCGVDIKKSWTHSPRSNVHLYDTEYVVLVPIAHAAPVAPKPPTIDYSREFLGATRESVYEVWARGKAAMARKEAQDASERLKAISEKARTVRVTTAEDADLLADYTQQASSLYRQAAHWMREESKYTELADAAAAKIKERKVA